MMRIQKVNEKQGQGSIIKCLVFYIEGFDFYPKGNRTLGFKFKGDEIKYNLV